MGSYDFVNCRTNYGKAIRTLNIIDGFSRECLAIKVDRKLVLMNIIDALADLFILRGAPASSPQTTVLSSSLRLSETGLQH